MRPVTEATCVDGTVLAFGTVSVLTSPLGAVFRIERDLPIVPGCDAACDFPSARGSPC